MKSKDGAQGVADETLWRDLYPFMYMESTKFATAAQEIENVVRLTGVGAGEVLDLCCGPGRHTVELAKRGFKVTAVDRIEFLLDKARAHAAAASVSVDFFLEDMRRFTRPQSFDLILNLATSFGYSENEADDLRALQRMRDNLKTGGTLVIEMLMGKEWIAKKFQPTESKQLPNGDLLFQRNSIIDDWTRVQNEWTLIRDGRISTIEFRQRVYSGHELKELLRAAGLHDVRVYGDLDGRPYGLEAEHLVAVARR